MKWRFVGLDLMARWREGHSSYPYYFKKYNADILFFFKLFSYFYVIH